MPHAGFPRFESFDTGVGLRCAQPLDAIDSAGSFDEFLQRLLRWLRNRAARNKIGPEAANQTRLRFAIGKIVEALAIAGALAKAEPFKLVEQRATLALIEIAGRRFAAAHARDDPAIGHFVETQPLLGEMDFR